MTNFRIFVEKHAEYNIEAQQLLLDLQQNLHITNLKQLRLINLYDVFNLSQEEIQRAKYVVFAEAPVDTVYFEVDLNQANFIALEPLPGQYDQRADSALQALNLLEINNPGLSLTSGKLVILNGPLTSAELAKIKAYYLNPLEMREKDLNTLQALTPAASFSAVAFHAGFLKLNSAELAAFRHEQALAMTLADLACIQTYFSSEEREPSETEIKVLDTYWSDHCRHTTFETNLTDIQFAAGKYRKLFQETFNRYLASRQHVYADTAANNRPITLMDLATICAKELRKNGKLAAVEFSDEINACSLCIEIMVDGKPETWSLQFKNETHNHPTEIEPYGGASTCIGGAIRDPLSGRAYVYQAMRISGAANPLEAIEDTLSGKLPQKVITTRAANGFSAYGNQIGLATSYVHEIYHSGYKAKRMEVGMVVAAAPFSNIRRESPIAGDVIILLGGRTGRDGCGGATGSSKEHNVNSAAVCGAEVQKGNPIVERKIQRLFRNPQLTQLIKKCNDFGAGGVSVAIGELADGVVINLDKVPTKYNGLSGTELAISESQERMAVVVAAADAAHFIQLAEAENLEAVTVAEVTAHGDSLSDANAAARMVMTYRGQTIVNLAREFLNTNGAKSSATIQVSQPAEIKSLSQFATSSFAERLHHHLMDLNICSQQGLVDRFDSTIGASTVLMPYGGKYQLTPAQVSVQKLPLLSGQSDAASIASYGFDPELSSWSPFHGAAYAVIDSVAKIVAAGADFTQIKFSFQEYFERLGQDPQKWGKPFAALLGAYHAQQGFSLAAIGGKDSMSGTFNQLHVPATLISFALAPTLASAIISPEFKASGEAIYAFIPNYDGEEMVDFNQLTTIYKIVNKFILAGKINAAWAIGQGGIAEAIVKMSFGNMLGVELAATVKHDLFAAYYGGIVFSSAQPLTAEDLNGLNGQNLEQPNSIGGANSTGGANSIGGSSPPGGTSLIGYTNNLATIRCFAEEVDLADLLAAHEQVLAAVFPKQAKVLPSLASKEALSGFSQQLAKASAGNVNLARSNVKFAAPRVIIPVFPGSNCEYDSLRAFNAAGANSTSMVFNNLSAKHIQASIAELVAQINRAQILMLPGGFSAGDEPDGSAKFIASILRNPRVSAALSGLLARDGLILGICNGFQALIKSGLLPYARVCDLSAKSATLTYNLIGRHISRLVPTKIINNSSPWLSSFQNGEIKQIAMSHGEGRLVLSAELARELAQNGQIACQYVDLKGSPTLDGNYNPNGSDYAIEALTAANGRILGKMGHSERMGANLYKNISGDKTQDIFKNGVNYFN